MALTLQRRQLPNLAEGELAPNSLDGDRHAYVFRFIASAALPLEQRSVAAFVAETQGYIELASELRSPEPNGKNLGRLARKLDEISRNRILESLNTDLCFG